MPHTPHLLKHPIDRSRLSFCLKPSANALIESDLCPFATEIVGINAYRETLTIERGAQALNNLTLFRKLKKSFK